VPQDVKVMTLPQRPYLPPGSLEAAITYPAAPGTFKRGQLVAALHDVGLVNFSERLDEVAHWSQQLSLGEQQKVGIARAIVLSPDYLFLDKATRRWMRPPKQHCTASLKQNCREPSLGPSVLARR